MKEEIKNFNNIKINLYCIKCLIITKTKKNKIKCKINGKSNIFSCYIDCGSKNFETNDEEDCFYT